MGGDELEDLDARDARARDADSLIDEDIDTFDDDDDEDDFDDTDDDDDDDDDDYLDDATDEDIDLVVAAYREDGEAVVVPMAKDLANDLDELITQLRRLPGDTGAIGAVSIAGEFFVLVRVRGRTVEVVLSDAYAANDWPIARDVADYLGVEVSDDDDEDVEALGDLDLFADLGLGEMDMESLVEEAEENSEEAVVGVFERLKFGSQLARALDQQRGAR